jgi:hypothetical protein
MTAGGRDRDQAGRPRNARPRDAAGRPLPHDATGEPRIPDDLALSAAETLELAQRLLDEGRPFQAHEVLEAAWKTGPAAERDLWQGLAQVAVGLTHAQRGNARGAVTLLRRGAGRIGGYAPVTEAGPGRPDIDVRAVIQAASELAGRVERDGLDAVSADDLRLRLPAGPPAPA